MSTDWESLYQKGDTHWDKGAPSPGLVDFLDGKGKPKSPSSVLVPGCGFGHDVRAWATFGYQATGYDLAPSAVAGARQLTSAGPSAIFKQGDLLRDPVDSRFDWVFEHTLFCAIDPEERDRYVDAVADRLVPTGRYLSIFYMLPIEDEGPPFGSTRSEITRRFYRRFVPVEEWVPSSYPNREGKELMILWALRTV